MRQIIHRRRLQTEPTPRLNPVDTLNKSVSLYVLDLSTSYVDARQPRCSVYVTPGTCPEVDLFPMSTNYTASVVTALFSSCMSQPRGVADPGWQQDLITKTHLMWCHLN